ncbi:MAG TPA: DUF3352 domain-containing protein [Candidatus Limnocylindria bacterium]|nr:DUF3352 domain-containing protein [Candidatus Limnocylindria bacterium]
MQRLVVALVALIGLTGVAVVAAYLFIFSIATDRAAALAPASSAVYVNVYLQPSTGQQMNLAGLIGRLPGFADEASLDEKVNQIVENLLSETGIDYRTQVKPWLGDQIALAGWARADDPEQLETVVIVAVSDREQAESSVAGLVDQAGTTTESETYEGVELHVADGGSYAFVSDMLVVGSNAESLRAVVDVAGGAASLAGRQDFVDAMERIPSDHLASAFADLAAVGAATGVEQPLGQYTTASAALVAEEEGLRLSGSAPFDAASAAPSARDRFALGTEPSSLPDWMPEDTIAEAVLFGLRQTFEDAEDALGAAPEAEDVTSALDTIRAIAAFGLGLDLDADVLPLFDREVGIAITGFDGDLPSGQLLLRPDDPEAAADTVGRIADRLAALGGSRSTENHDGVEITVLGIPDTGEFAYAVAEGILIVGFSPGDVAAALDAHDGGTSLSDTDAYRRAFEVAGTRAGAEAFVNVPAVVELAGDQPDLPADARDILGQVDAFALTLPSREDQIEFHAVLTIDDAASPN